MRCWMLSKLTVTTTSQDMEVKSLCHAPYPDTVAYVNYLTTKLREAAATAMVQVRYNERLIKGGHWVWKLGLGTKRRGLTGSLAV